MEMPFFLNPVAAGPKSGLLSACTTCGLLAVTLFGYKVSDGTQRSLCTVDKLGWIKRELATGVSHPPVPNGFCNRPRQFWDSLRREKQDVREFECGIDPALE